MFTYQDPFPVDDVYFKFPIKYMLQGISLIAFFPVGHYPVPITFSWF